MNLKTVKGASSLPQLLLGNGPCALDWVMVRKRLLRSTEARCLPRFPAGSSLSGAQHSSEDLLDDPHSVFLQEFNLLGASFWALPHLVLPRYGGVSSSPEAARVLCCKPVSFQAQEDSLPGQASPPQPAWSVWKQ